MICDVFNGTRRMRGVLESCVRRGSYGLRACAGSVSAVLDVGANVGMFSVTSRVLCPDAQVLALEPDPTSWRNLLPNADHLDIQCLQAGLGDGRPIRMWQCPPKERSCFGVRYDSGGGGELELPSYRVQNLASWLAVDPAELFIKCDCEGAEHVMVGDQETERILVASAGFGGEVHETYPGATKQFEGWLKALLSATHKVWFAGHTGAAREFNAVRKRQRRATPPPLPDRTVRWTSDLRDRTRGRLRAGELATAAHHEATHRVCRGQATLEVAR